MDLRIKCTRVEVHPSWSYDIKATIYEIEEQDLNTDEVYDAIDVEKFIEHKGVNAILRDMNRNEIINWVAEQNQRDVDEFPF